MKLILALISIAALSGCVTLSFNDKDGDTIGFRYSKTKGASIDAAFKDQK